MSDQTQPVRPGDVYPPTAAGKDARRQRERDEFLAREQQPQQQKDGGLRVTEADQHDGSRVVTASAGGQLIAQFTAPTPGGETDDAVTIGEALQAAASDAPVGLADAAAAEAAETRATGLGRVVPGGVAAAAHKAAETNMRLGGGVGDADEEMVRLRDVAVTREDARKVAAAAEKNAAEGGGSDVADAVAAASEMNKGKMTR
ncbi:hypothetical protein QYE76_000466 [Lolium multiflorum]|uniref:SMP domain-containing protein n=1 Tax=Lolium multiflorum TaxID=4521 RepID=A0AAD8RHK9_LOLMU|nr:hypothetical protein QYE76_000466 [Lolium multiflorum]